MTAPANAVGGDPTVDFRDDRARRRNAILTVGYLVILVYYVVVALFWGILPSDSDRWEIGVVPLVVMVALGCPAAGLWCMSAWSFVPGSANETRIRRVAQLLLIVGLLADVTVVVLGVETHPPIWAPSSVVLLALVVSVLALTVARRLRSSPVGLGDVRLGPWLPLPPRMTPRYVWIVVASAVVVFGFAVLFQWPWGYSTHGSPPLSLTHFLLAVSFALLASGVVVWVKAIPLIDRTTALVGRSLALRWTLRSSLRDTGAPVAPHEVELIRRYAAVVTLLSPLEALVGPMFVAAFVCEQVGIALDGDPLFWIPAGSLVVALIIAETFWWRRLLCARRFLQAHGEPGIIGDVPAGPV